ncbi:hypothetical protein Bca4012_102022 [Brassica carinata]
MEITSTSVRMRVQINGLLPLIKASVIEYANGDEVTANFIYEKLEKHCPKCFRLDHDIKYCLEAKHEERALKAQEDSLQNEERERERLRSRHHHASGSNREASSRSRDLRKDPSDKYVSRDRSLQPSGSRDRVTQRREELPKPIVSLDRGIPLQEIQSAVPEELFNEAVNEVRDAMIQYTQCNDPTESAARRERMRKAEEEGDIEEAATLMIQATLGTNANQPLPMEQTSAERVPTTLRLGPMIQPTTDTTHDAPMETGKRKPGRPPGKRKVQGSPKLQKGSSSRKRKLQQTKPPLLDD